MRVFPVFEVILHNLDGRLLRPFFCNDGGGARARWTIVNVRAESQEDVPVKECDMDCPRLGYFRTVPPRRAFWKVVMLGILVGITPVILLNGYTVALDIISRHAYQTPMASGDGSRAQLMETGRNLAHWMCW
jgi:hypothetical protein